MNSLLSKNINNIINKYLDYSFNNFLSIFNQNKTSVKYQLIDPNITAEDIMIKCVRIGHTGFYAFNTSFTNELINQLISKFDSKKLFKILNKVDYIEFTFMNNPIERRCHIGCLNILKYN